MPSRLATFAASNILYIVLKRKEVDNHNRSFDICEIFTLTQNSPKPDIAQRYQLKMSPEQETLF